MKKVQQYFKDYPTSKQCFETSDGFLFHHEGDARLHAAGLKNKTVTTHNAGAVGESVDDKVTKALTDAVTGATLSDQTDENVGTGKAPAPAKEAGKKAAAAKGEAKKTTGK